MIIESGAKIEADSNSNVGSITIKDSFINQGTISNTSDSKTPFKLNIGGDLKNSGTISSNSNIEVCGNVNLSGGELSGDYTLILNNVSGSTKDFNVTGTEDKTKKIKNITVQNGKYNFTIADTFTIEGTLSNSANGEVHLKSGNLIINNYTGSGDIHLYKGSNLTITNYIGTGTIYLQEGATLTIGSEESATSTIAKIDRAKQMIREGSMNFAEISDDGDLPF